MNRYFRLSATGTAICFAICAPSVILDFVPTYVQFWCSLCIYFCFSGGVVPLLVGVFSDVLAKRGRWNSPRFRCFAVPILGALVGLFLLGWCAVLGSSNIEYWKHSKISSSKVLYINPALFSQFELLSMIKVFIENSLQFAGVYAAVSMLGVWMYDRLKPRWYTVTFLIGFLPSSPHGVWAFIVFMEKGFVHHVTSGEIGLGLLNWMLSGTFLGFLLTCIVWSVREGWWTLQPLPTMSADIAEFE